MQRRFPVCIVVLICIATLSSCERNNPLTSNNNENNDGKIKTTLLEVEKAYDLIDQATTYSLNLHIENDSSYALEFVQSGQFEGVVLPRNESEAISSWDLLRSGTIHGLSKKMLPSGEAYPFIEWVISDHDLTRAAEMIFHNPIDVGLRVNLEHTAPVIFILPDPNGY